MMRVLLKAKILRATVTDRSLDYEGSITIDEDLMDAVGLLPNEQVQVYNVTNGQRFETYAIRGERGTGTICINGAAAHLAENRAGGAGNTRRRTESPVADALAWSCTTSASAPCAFAASTA